MGTVFPSLAVIIEVETVGMWKRMKRASTETNRGHVITFLRAQPRGGRYEGIFGWG